MQQWIYTETRILYPCNNIRCNSNKTTTTNNKNNYTLGEETCYKVDFAIPTYLGMENKEREKKTCN